MDPVVPSSNDFFTDILKPPRQVSRYDRVIIHPLVLLNAVDHYNRSDAVISEDERVVGVLLGTASGRVLDITNSFAVPFSEEGSYIWYLNDDYLDTMYGMFWKINAREKIVGWYHTGPDLRPNDVEICDFFRKYNPDPVLVIIRSQPFSSPSLLTNNNASNPRMPTQAYLLTEQLPNEVGVSSLVTFEHLACEIEAEEAEEVGVEHLLRGIRNITAGSLSQRVDKQIGSAEGLAYCLHQIKEYLEEASKSGDETTFYNNAILEHLQHIINPLYDQLEGSKSFSKHFLHALNDQMAVIYVAVLCRAIVSLHDLINNRLSNRNAEKAAVEKAEAAKKAEAEKATLSAKKSEGTGANEKGRLV
ncbi:hypothetical protein ACOME3_000238 [Neoechinorhynchus agilis]